MRSLICFTIALALGIPVSWATQDWPTGRSVVVVGMTVLFVYIATVAISFAVAPGNKPWWREEQRVQ